MLYKYILYIQNIIYITYNIYYIYIECFPHQPQKIHSSYLYMSHTLKLTTCSAIKNFQEIKETQSYTIHILGPQYNKKKKQYQEDLSKSYNYIKMKQAALK